MTRIVSAAAALDFPSTNAGLSSDLTITVVGVATGDCIVLGVPAESTIANTLYTAFVSNSTTGAVTVRFQNAELLTARDPASGTFRASAIKF